MFFLQYLFNSLSTGTWLYREWSDVDHLQAEEIILSWHRVLHRHHWLNSLFPCCILCSKFPHCNLFIYQQKMLIMCFSRAYPDCLCSLRKAVIRIPTLGNSDYFQHFSPRNIVDLNSLLSSMKPHSLNVLSHVILVYQQVTSVTLIKSFKKKTIQ